MQKPKTLKIWVQGETKPKEFVDALDALKDKDVIQNATSASVEIVERIDTEGSTLTSKSNAGLRNWAFKQLDAITGGNKKLSFLDVKYVPKEEVGNKVTGEVKEYPAKLVFRKSIPRDNS